MLHSSQGDSNEASASNSSIQPSVVTIGTSSPPPPQPSDVKALLKTMLLGLKTVIWCVHNYPPALTANQAKSQKNFHSFTSAEKSLLAKYVEWGMSCLKVYRSPASEGSSPQYKEILESFSSSLAVVPPATLRSILLELMPSVFETLLDDPTIMQVIQGLLMNNSVSRAVCEGMMSWLMTRLDELGQEVRGKKGGATAPPVGSPLRTGVRAI